MFKVIITILMMFSFSFAGKIEIEKLSSTNLEKDFKSSGLDLIVKNFSNVSHSLYMKFSNIKEGAKGIKVSSKDDKELLLKFVQAAQEITNKYDKGNLHYYSFAKLYKVIPLDLSLAIERSGLTAEEKKNMRETLKNNLD